MPEFSDKSWYSKPASESPRRPTSPEPRMPLALRKYLAAPDSSFDSDEEQKLSHTTVSSAYNPLGRRKIIPKLPVPRTIPPLPVGSPESQFEDGAYEDEVASLQKNTDIGVSRLEHSSYKTNPASAMKDKSQPSRYWERTKSPDFSSDFVEQKDHEGMQNGNKCRDSTYADMLRGGDGRNEQIGDTQINTTPTEMYTATADESPKSRASMSDHELAWKMQILQMNPRIAPVQERETQSPSRAKKDVNSGHASPVPEQTKQSSRLLQTKTDSDPWNSVKTDAKPWDTTNTAYPDTDIGRYASRSRAKEASTESFNHQAPVSHYPKGQVDQDMTPNDPWERQLTEKRSRDYNEMVPGFKSRNGKEPIRQDAKPWTSDLIPYTVTSASDLANSCQAPAFQENNEQAWHEGYNSDHQDPGHEYILGPSIEKIKRPVPPKNNDNQVKQQTSMLYMKGRGASKYDEYATVEFGPDPPLCGEYFDPDHERKFLPTRGHGVTDFGAPNDCQDSHRISRNHKEFPDNFQNGRSFPAKIEDYDSDPRCDDFNEEKAVSKADRPAQNGKKRDSQDARLSNWDQPLENVRPRNEWERIKEKADHHEQENPNVEIYALGLPSAVVLAKIRQFEEEGILVPGELDKKAMSLLSSQDDELAIHALNMLKRSLGNNWLHNISAYFMGIIRSLRRSPDKYLEELEREKRRGYQWVPKDVARQGKDLPEWPGSDNPKHTKWDDPPSMYRANTQNSLAFSHEEEASERDYRSNRRNIPEVERSSDGFDRNTESSWHTQIVTSRRQPDPIASWWGEEPYRQASRTAAREAASKLASGPSKCERQAKARMKAGGIARPMLMMPDSAEIVGWNHPLPPR